MARIDGDLRRIFRRAIIRSHWTTIETGDTQGGVPDSHVTLDHTMVFVEFKRTTGNTVKFRPLQAGWHLSCAHYGGRSLIAVRREYAGTRILPPADELYIVAGAAIERLRDDGLAGLAQGDIRGKWSGGPSGWDWSEVRGILADR